MGWVGVRWWRGWLVGCLGALTGKVIVCWDLGLGPQGAQVGEEHPLVRSACHQACRPS